MEIIRRYNEALTWIFKHLDDVTAYAFALVQMHWSRDEIREELVDECGLTDEEVDKIFENLNL